MNKVLLIHSSMFGNDSKSLVLARELIVRLPHTSLVERPLAPDKIPSTWRGRDELRGLTGLRSPRIADIGASHTEFPICCALSGWHAAKN